MTTPNITEIARMAISEPLSRSIEEIEQMGVAVLALIEINKELEAAMTEQAQDALEDVADWGAYADEYFKKKWGLDECLEKWKSRTTKPAKPGDKP